MSSVEATRPVQKSWVYQYGNNGQPQRVPRVQRVSRNDGKKAYKTDVIVNKPAVAITPRGTRASIDDLYFKETTGLVPLRAPVERIPPEYIERRTGDLTEYIEYRF